MAELTGQTGLGSVEQAADQSGASSADGEYVVRLDAFHGPLDLLLYLIRRAEVDIHDIPIAPITDQYMAYVRAATKDRFGLIDINSAGEFLVMAATLMEIKSRMLLPVEEDSENQREAACDVASTDPRADLVRQLVAYKRYRDAAAILESRLSEWEARVPLAAAEMASMPVQEVDADAPAELDDIDILDLVAAFGTILETVDLNRVGEHRVVDDETPIEIHAADLLDRLSRDGQDLAQFGSESAPGQLQFPRRGLRLGTIFSGRTRAEAIGLFLALLELLRQHKIVAMMAGGVGAERPQGDRGEKLVDDPEEILIALRDPVAERPSDAPTF